MKEVVNLLSQTSASSKIMLVTRDQGRFTRVTKGRENND